MSSVHFLIDEPSSTKANGTVILAHGAGAPMDSPFMQAFGEGMAARGIRAARFEFPYMAGRRESGKKRPPNPAGVLLDTWREAIADIGGPVVVGGKSMGGRMASMIAAELESEGSPVAGVACLGYPFHPPGQPDKMRVDHLMEITTPVLILQGTRDPFGTRDEVPGFGLPRRIAIEWLKDGDHGFKPRKASGLSEQDNWEQAMDLLAAFAVKVLG
ncbi:MAG: alpha/beta fold hydrolase [Rhodospirillales bacterium]